MKKTLRFLVLLVSLSLGSPTQLYGAQQACLAPDDAIAKMLVSTMCAAFFGYGTVQTYREPANPGKGCTLVITSSLTSLFLLMAVTFPRLVCQA